MIIDVVIMDKKDIILAIFGAAVGLAGVLLVLVGFIYAHAETIELAATRSRNKRVAKFGMVPFLITMACATLSLRWMSGPADPVFCWSLYGFYAGMATTALYGIVAFLFYL
jgi:hypothetical protein